MSHIQQSCDLFLFRERESWDRGTVLVRRKVEVSDPRSSALNVFSPAALVQLEKSIEDKPRIERIQIAHPNGGREVAETERAVVPREIDHSSHRLLWATPRTLD